MTEECKHDRLNHPLNSNIWICCECKEMFNSQKEAEAKW